MSFGLLAGAGGLFKIAGTALGAGGANKRKKQMEEIANTPGLDFNDITQSALGGYESVFDRAAALSGRLSRTNQEQLNAQEELALPGVAAARQKALGKISSLFDEDSEFLKGLSRRGAAMNLSSGLMGSQAGQIGMLRLSDREVMQRTQLGTGLLGALIDRNKLALTPGAQAFLGPTISEQVNQRSNERTQRMGMLAQAAGMPTGKEMWGQTLDQVGGAMMGMGAMGMLGGGSMLGGMGGGSGGWYGSSIGLSSTAPQGWYGMPLYQQQRYMNQSQNAQTYGSGIDFT